MSECRCSQEGLSQRDGARGSAPRTRGDSDPMRTPVERRNLCTNSRPSASTVCASRPLAYIESELSSPLHIGVVFDIDRNGTALHYSVRDHHVGDRRHYLRLYQALERARAVLRVVALLREMRQGCIRKRERDALLL